MQEYLYVLFYTATNPKQLLCIISRAQAIPIPVTPVGIFALYLH